MSQISDNTFVKKSSPFNITSCEFLHYHGNSSDDVSFPAEPFSAYSGIVLCLIALFGPPYGTLDERIVLPLEYWLSKASVFACGVGTFLFHAMDKTDNARFGINPYEWDYMTMAMIVSNISLLYVHSKNRYLKCIMSYWVVMYLLFAAYSNDSLSFVYLWEHTDGLISSGIQYPLFVIPFVVMFVYILGWGSSEPNPKLNWTWEEIVPLAFSLAIACGFWLYDRAFCDGESAVFFGHGIWHIGIAYSCILFIIFGLRKRAREKESTFDIEGTWWPIVVWKQSLTTIP